VCEAYDYRLVAPPADLCTDNGAMIAWNAYEKLQAGKIDLIRPEDVFERLQLAYRADFGQDWRAIVAEKYIKCHWIKLLEPK